MSDKRATKLGPFRIGEHLRSGVKTGKWLVDLPPHLSPTGRRKRLFFANRTEALAEAKRLLRELQIDGSIRGYGPRPLGITFAEAAKRWIDGQLDRVATNKKRQISLSTHAIRLKALLVELASKDLAAITSADAVKYQKVRISAGKAAATVNSETRLLKQILTWCGENGLGGQVPKIEPIPEFRKRLVVPTIDEVNRIIAALPDRIALLVQFLAETGCRKGEAFALEWSDISEAERLVMIHRKKEWTPKTAHSDRDIPLGPSLLADLLDAKAAARLQSEDAGVALSTLVFPGRGGGRMWNFEKQLARAVKAAGVMRDDSPMHITPHMLRKANATWLKQRGVDDSLLQPRLGHAPGSSVTAHNYVHLPTDAMRDTIIDLKVEREKLAEKRRIEAANAVPMATNGNTPK